jgi:hypothetical protein
MLQYHSINCGGGDVCGLLHPDLKAGYGLIRVCTVAVGVLTQYRKLLKLLSAYSHIIVLFPCITFSFLFLIVFYFVFNFSACL